MKQRTIQNEVSVESPGLHTGKFVKLTFRPAPENHGIKFRRIDIGEDAIVEADVKYVFSTNRSTSLSKKDIQIYTVEHVLSAARGLEVDNLLIDIDGPEVPIMDGSARKFIEALESAGFQEQQSERKYFEITETIRYTDEMTGTELVALPADEFQVTTMIDFNSQVLGQQYAQLNTMSQYKDEISPCRTFVFLHELEALLKQGLIKGGDFDNAIVIVDRIMSQKDLDELAEKLDRPSIKVDSEGILNTTELNFSNEPARHKLLDVIGDLSLVGIPIKGKIVATKPGHTANVQFARLLQAEAKIQRRLSGIPKYSSESEVVFTTQQIAEKLPHRFPFLLVDKVIELTKEYVVGVKNVTFNEQFFQGHFPSNPVMPGVLQLEALAQVGGIYALSIMPDDVEYDTYFLKIDNAKFKRKVVPGDSLVLKAELLSPIRRGLCHMQCTAYVGNEIASEAEMVAQIVARKK